MDSALCHIDQQLTGEREPFETAKGDNEKVIVNGIDKFLSLLKMPETVIFSYS